MIYALTPGPGHSVHGRSSAMAVSGTAAEVLGQRQLVRSKGLDESRNLQLVIKMGAQRGLNAAARATKISSAPAHGEAHCQTFDNFSTLTLGRLSSVRTIDVARGCAGSGAPPLHHNLTPDRNIRNHSAALATPFRSSQDGGRHAGGAGRAHGCRPVGDALN